MRRQAWGISALPQRDISGSILSVDVHGSSCKGARFYSFTDTVLSVLSLQL